MKNVPTELPPDPTTFTIASMLAEWVIVPATMFGIVGVTAFLNYLFAGINPILVVSATGILALIIAFLMGGLFRNKGIGRLTVWGFGFGVCIVYYISLRLGRGLPVIPMSKTTNMDLGMILYIGSNIFWWVYTIFLFAHTFATKQMRLLHLRIQNVTMIIRNALVVCGIVFVVLVCFTANSMYDNKNIPSYSYTEALRMRVAAYQRNPPVRYYHGFELADPDALGQIGGSTKVLQGAGSRLVSGSYSVFHNKNSDIWLVETYPRISPGEDEYTHMLVRGSDGLVLAKW